MIRRRLALALLCLPSLAQGGGVFWTDRGASQLKRMDFGGANLQTILLGGQVGSPGSNTRGIALDALNNRIFWADNGADRLLRANLDGSSSAILYTIPGGNSFPADVWIDPAGHLYWCDQLRNRIQRSNLDGGSVTDVITNAAPTGPYFMDVDPAAGKIYWGDFGGGSIFRANLDSSQRETLLTGNNQTRGVRVDPGEGMLYWINRDDKKVHRCPLASFAAGPLPLTHPAVQTLYSNLDTPHGLALDIPARKLYWADTGTNPGLGEGGQAVSRGDFDGSTPAELLASGTEPWDVEIDVRCTSYGEWRRRCFRNDASPAQTDPNADPDGDGLSNALEYGFDLSPLQPDQVKLAHGFLTVGPAGSARYPALKFRRRSGTLDLVYQVRASTDLANWEGSPADPIEVETRPLAGGMEEVTVRTLDAVSGYTTHFLRLDVTLGSLP